MLIPNRQTTIRIKKEEKIIPYLKNDFEIIDNDDFKEIIYFEEDLVY